jgi:hypothetical protein
VSDEHPGRIPPPPGSGREGGAGEPTQPVGGAAEPPPHGWGEPAGGYGPGYQPASAQGGPNGLAIAALVCGLVALPLAIIVIGGLVGVAAVVLGALGLRRARDLGGSGRGLAIGGIVTGLLAAVGTVLLVAGVVAVLQDPEVREEIEREMERIEEQQQEVEG